MTRLDWEKARKHNPRPFLKPRKAGITNSQAKLLASLQREHGVTYSGAGISRGHASRLISKLLAAKEMHRQPLR